MLNNILTWDLVKSTTWQKVANTRKTHIQPPPPQNWSLPQPKTTNHVAQQKKHDYLETYIFSFYDDDYFHHPAGGGG